jgi:hypothetical protein
VDVGEELQQKSFYVQETLLRQHSLFFKKALSRDWKEKVERIVNLPEDEPTLFAVYVEFLYSGNLAVVPEDLDPIDATHLEQHMLCKLYVLAEKLQDMDTRNRAIQGLLYSAKQVRPGNSSICPGMESIKIIYDGTLPGSMARKLLIDYYTYRGTGSWVIDHKGWPDDFLIDLATNLMDKRAIPNDPTRNGNGAEYMEKEQNKSDG